MCHVTISDWDKFWGNLKRKMCVNYFFNYIMQFVHSDIKKLKIKMWSMIFYILNSQCKKCEWWTWKIVGKNIFRHRSSYKLKIQLCLASFQILEMIKDVLRQKKETRRFLFSVQDKFVYKWVMYLLKPLLAIISACESITVSPVWLIYSSSIKTFP